jgi:hypothetical protein
MKKFLILSAFAFIAFGMNAQTDAAGKPGKATSETVEKKKEDAPQGKTAAATSQRSARVGQVKGGTTDAPETGAATQGKDEKAGASCGKSGSQAAGGCCSKGGATAAEGKSGGCCSGASGAACGKGSTKPEKKQ